MNQTLYGIQIQSFSVTLGLLSLIIFLRYLLLSGSFYWLCEIKNRQKWAFKRIQKSLPSRQQIWREIGWSGVTSAIFGFTGALIINEWTQGNSQIYERVSDRGIIYFFLSIALYLFLHETYFYWTHRIFHLPRVFRKIHFIHHQSSPPTPWSAFSFHPYEAVLQSLILWIMISLIPIHPLALLIFLMMMTFLSIINHGGYELYPSGFEKHGLGKWVITATHHQQHHSNYHCNFGLYFTFWDRWLGTQHPEYEHYYSKIKSRVPTPENQTP